MLGISLSGNARIQKMRFWNIGAEGQTLIGCLATTTCMILLGGKVSNFLLIVISLAAARLVAVWGSCPPSSRPNGTPTRRCSPLMMNYIAMQLASYFIIIWEVPKGAGKIGIINQASEPTGCPASADRHSCSHSGGRTADRHDVYLSHIQQARL